MHVLVLKSVTPNSNYEQSKKRPQNIKKSLCSMGYYSLWYVKIDLYPSQNLNLSTSLETPSQELLNASFSFEIGCTNSYYGQLKLAPEMAQWLTKSPTYNPWFFSGNWQLDKKTSTDLSLPNESPYKELLNACFNFETRHS